jgi:radical SAM protein with 4Fe4S-binding SPASM domain
MKTSTYSKNNKHLVIIPDVPRWFVLDDFGLQVFDIIANQNKSFFDVCREFKTTDDLEETYHYIVNIIDKCNNQKAEVIERNLTSRTTVAMVSITRNCNLKCPHCYVDAKGCLREELTVKEHQNIAQQIKECLTFDARVIYRVNLTGGEPFLNPQIIEIIKSYRKYDLEISMSTNALLIQEQQIDELQRLEVTLQVSLDGSSPITHDLIRGNGAFNRLIDQIKKLTSSGVRVGVNHLIVDKNFYDLEKTICLAYELGCQGFNPINLVQLGRACDSSLQRVPEVEVFKRLAQHLKKHPEHEQLFEKTSLFSSLGAALLSGVTCSSCGVGNRPCVYIDSEGNVYPCTNTQCSEFLLGNIRNQPLKECVKINHPILQYLKTLNVDTLNSTCSQCDVRKFCGGDCRGETFNVTGDIYAPYVACKDRHDSLIELMWITAEQPEIFENRANEYLKTAEKLMALKLSNGEDSM